MFKDLPKILNLKGNFKEKIVLLKNLKSIKFIFFPRFIKWSIKTKIVDFWEKQFLKGSPKPTFLISHKIFSMDLSLKNN